MFLQIKVLLFFVGLILFLSACSDNSSENDRDKDPPNVLLLMSDNHYFEHLGCYGDSIVKTPNIDSVAASGFLFTHAFCGSPSCTPARSALLAGQEIWRLGEAANLWSSLADSIPIYTDLLEKHGYSVGHDRKGWGPGDFRAGGRSRNPAGYTYKNFQQFLDENGERPWCYWLSSKNPHRPFEHGAGIEAGIDPNQVFVPPYLPDVPEIRADICDYYYQIQLFDQEVGKAMQLLAKGDLQKNTIVIICGDNGWMMPRGLANLYDFGTRVPLIISHPAWSGSGDRIEHLVSLNDLAPTILEMCAVEIPETMTAGSLLPYIQDDTMIGREFICFGRERHALCRQEGLGYPGRAIRTKKYLYIQNLEPDRWPAGDPPLYGDIDLHMLQDQCPTKEYMMLHADDEGVKELFEAAFLKRPKEELFDLSSDPFQMNNVATVESYQPIREELETKLTNYLHATQDPRARGDSLYWDTQMYYKEKDWTPTPRPEAQQKFNLKAKYSYRNK